jgi:hypothetical protein
MDATTDPRPIEAAARRRWVVLAGGAAIAVATAAVMIATAPRLAITWDEGFTIGREERLRFWFQALADPVGFASRFQPPAESLVQWGGEVAPLRDEIDTRGELLFNARALGWFWPFARREPHGHPPFYALVGLIGDVLAPSWAVLPRARLGPMLVFSLTAGAVFVFMARRYGPWPGALAAGAWMLQPNLFALAHYATYDAILTALWVGAVLAFANAVEPSTRSPSSGPRWGWVVLFGLLAGCAADTKLTGWFVPFPLLAWTGLRRDRRGLWTLLAGGGVALAFLYLANPHWWLDPYGGVETFLRSNLTRGKTAPIPVLFLGRVVMTPNESLPWYNTLFWTVLVTPVGFLALAIAGAVRGIARSRSEPFGLLAVLNWLFVLVLRALPHVPGHDGVRQFLPAFGVLALVAGLGAATAVERLGRWGKALVAAALVEGAVSLAVMMPVPLSYFSPLVGGLPGAAALGMEPTYYWDALSGDALDWLNQHTPPGQMVRFATYPSSWLYLRRIGRLKPEITPFLPGRRAWFVLQNRPGAFFPRDRALVARGHPAFVVRKWGVPLIWIFPYDEFEAFEPRTKP